VPRRDWRNGGRGHAGRAANAAPVFVRCTNNPLAHWCQDLRRTDMRDEKGPTGRPGGTKSGSARDTSTSGRKCLSGKSRHALKNLRL
jgi:hypothetical protein